MIANPDYAPDAKLAQRCVDCGMVGFELWQVKSGTLFDDIIVTDSLEEAQAFAKDTYEKKKGPEKDMYDAQMAEQKAKEEEARAAAAEDEEEEEEEEDHEEL